MNIIEEIESIKTRINKEIADHWREVMLLIQAADKLGYKPILPAGLIRNDTTATTTPVESTPMQAPGYQKAPTTKATQEETCKVVKHRGRGLRGARNKALRAIATGHVTTAMIGKVIYGEDNRVSAARAYANLYHLEQMGYASSIVLDTDKFGRRKAWTITQKGKSFLDSQS